MCTSLRMAAPIITIVGLPSNSRRLQRAAITGLYRLATMAGQNSALRKRALPVLHSLALPRTEEPETRCRGAKPIKAASLRA